MRRARAVGWPNRSEVTGIMRYNAVESRYTGQNLVLILSNKQQQQLIRAVGALEAQGWLAAVLRLRLLSACDPLNNKRCALECVLDLSLARISPIIPRPCPD